MPEDSIIMVLKTSGFPPRSDRTTTMKLRINIERIKIDRQKIARGHASGRAQVVQSDQRTQRERDRGAQKRSVLSRELEDR
jgi:hypothetical protein